MARTGSKNCNKMGKLIKTNNQFSCMFACLVRLPIELKINNEMIIAKVKGWIAVKTRRQVGLRNPVEII